LGREAPKYPNKAVVEVDREAFVREEGHARQGVTSLPEILSGHGVLQIGEIGIDYQTGAAVKRNRGRRAAKEKVPTL
jgi:hypothetical protein